MQFEQNEDRDSKVEEIFHYYGALPDRNRQETIVDMLRELQEVNGCIGPALVQQAARTAGVKEALIQMILKCYPSLKPAPFSHEIVVCTGRACAGKGNHELLQNLKRRLDIQKNGISSDGKVFLRTVNCLRNCRTAPNIFVDGVLYSGKTMDEIIKIVNAEFPD